MQDALSDHMDDIEGADAAFDIMENIQDGTSRFNWP